MSGLTHLGVELDQEEAQDVIDNLQDLVNLQEEDIERLAEALVECVPWIEIDARSQRQVGNLGAAERLEGIAERAHAALREAGIGE